MQRAVEAVCEGLSAIDIRSGKSEPQGLAKERRDDHGFRRRGGVRQALELRLGGETLLDELLNFVGLLTLAHHGRHGGLGLRCDALTALRDDGSVMMADHVCVDDVEREGEDVVRGLGEETLSNVFREFLAGPAEHGGVLGIEIIEKCAPRNPRCFANLFHRDVVEAALVHQLGGGVLNGIVGGEPFLFA